MAGARFMRSFPPLLVILIFAAAIGCGSPDKGHPNSWGSVTFSTPVKFSAPVDIGLDAVALVSPPERRPGAGRMEITLVKVVKDMAESIGDDETILTEYLKPTFLGITEKGTEAAGRAFLGKTIPGEIMETEVPVPGELVCYLVPLSGGDRLLVALRRAADTPAEEAETVLAMIAETLDEVQQKP